MKLGNFNIARSLSNLSEQQVSNDYMSKVFLPFFLPLCSLVFPPLSASLAFPPSFCLAGFSPSFCLAGLSPLFLPRWLFPPISASPAFPPLSASLAFPPLSASLAFPPSFCCSDSLIFFFSPSLDHCRTA